jgi:hypothetical protein
MTLPFRVAAGWLALGAGVAALGYAGLIVWHRMRYGHAARSDEPGTSTLLDRFIPAPEVVERHHIAIDAPPERVLAAAKDMRLMDAPLVRGVIRMRELALGGAPDRRMHPGPLVAQMQSIGWVVLAERAGREVVLGAATIPWHANPVFRSIGAGSFEAFREPGYVKIIWSLRAEPAGEGRTVFHTETRVSTTDAVARQQFRRYWSYVAPGVELIRLAMLRPLKRQCERSVMSVA